MFLSPSRASQPASWSRKLIPVGLCINDQKIQVASRTQALPGGVTVDSITEPAAAVPQGSWEQMLELPGNMYLFPLELVFSLDFV